MHETACIFGPAERAAFKAREAARRKRQEEAAFHRYWNRRQPLTTIDRLAEMARDIEAEPGNAALVARFETAMARL